MIAPFGIAAPGRILFGRGRAASEAADLVLALGHCVVLVHGRDPGRSAWLAAALAQRGAKVLTLAAAREPELSDLRDGVSAARDFAAETVVAIGGGAAIDLGKAVAALAPGATDPLDHLEVVGRGLPLAAPPLPFVALPTTAGTGSEATRNAVIGVPEAGRKVSLRDDRMLARLALVDPALTDGAPREITLASGLDALTQVIEPYLSTRASPFTDALCRAAIPAGLAALRRLTEAEEPDARDRMACVSLAGGLALGNAGLGAVHALAGVIGGQTGAPHGALCGALLPHVLRLHRAAHSPGTPIGDRLDEVDRWLADAFGTKDGVGALEDWMHRSGLPRLSALGLGAAGRTAAAAAAVEASSMRADPTRPDAAALERLLDRAG